MSDNFRGIEGVRWPRHAFFKEAENDALEARVAAAHCPSYF